MSIQWDDGEDGGNGFERWELRLLETLVKIGCFLGLVGVLVWAVIKLWRGATVWTNILAMGSDWEHIGRHKSRDWFHRIEYI